MLDSLFSHASFNVFLYAQWTFAQSFKNQFRLSEKMTHNINHTVMRANTTYLLQNYVRKGRYAL